MESAESFPDLKFEIESLKRQFEDQEFQLEEADSNKAIFGKLYDLKVIEGN